nr:hypothetical protein Ade03nite_12140 [Actinoplanes derwentensis]
MAGFDEATGLDEVAGFDEATGDRRPRATTWSRSSGAGALSAGISIGPGLTCADEARPGPPGVGLGVGGTGMPVSGAGECVAGAAPSPVAGPGGACRLRRDRNGVPETGWKAVTVSGKPAVRMGRKRAARESHQCAG